MTGIKATAVPTMITIEVRKMIAAIRLVYERMPIVNQESVKVARAIPAPTRVPKS